MLQFIENTDQIIENIKTMEQYLNSDNEAEKKFARELIKKGRAMLIYKVKGHNHFAPIRFIGFKKNSMTGHIDNEKRESRDTAPALQSLLGKPFTHQAIEKEFLDYANTIKGDTLKATRKYWRLRNDQNKYFELEETAGAIPEAIS